MPIMPFQSNPDDQWLFRTSPKSHSALKSHFSVDSSTYQIDANDSQLDDSRDQRNQQRSMQSWRSQEGFGHRATDSFRASDFPVVLTRPPLRPTVSSGSMSTYSFYSPAANELDKKSQALAIEEEAYRATSNVRVYSCVVMLCCLNLLYGMNVTSFATTLPTLAHDLSLTAVQSFWLVNIFFLSSAIIQPLSMRLSAAIGSKFVLSTGLLLWGTGSIVSAITGPFTILLLGRAITGVGAGAVGVLVPLVLRQLLTQKRPVSDRSVSISFWIGASIGPIVVGSLAKPPYWRYTFYLNLPICLVAYIGFPVLSRLPTAETSSWKGLLRLDYFGWLLLSGSITSLSLAMTWAGTQYPWTSLQTLLPLTTGTVCFLCFVIRTLYAPESILPISIFRKRKGVTACLGTLIHGMVFIGLVYFTALFYSVVGNLRPLTSALMLSPLTLALAILSLVGGIAITSFHRWSVWCSWAIVATSVGLLLLVRNTSIRTLSIPISMVVGIALGSLAGSLGALIQSTPTNDDETIHAVPLSVFFNTLGNALGLSIGSCVFLNRFGKAMHSTPALMGNADMFTLDAVRMAFVTQHLTTDQGDLKAALAAAYMNALHWVWIVLVILAGIAFLLSTYALQPSCIRRHDDQENHDSYY